MMSDEMKKMYFKIRLNQFYLLLVLVGAFNWLLTMYGYNLVEIINSSVNNLLGVNTRLNSIIYILVAFSAIMIAKNRNSWLPFLGDAVLPTSALIPDKIINGSVQVPIQTKPNIRIVYWASLPEKDNYPVGEAYGDFTNSGTTRADANGNAVLSINPSTAYVVPGGRTIKRHIHYREIDGEWGMMGEIKTVFY
jgi:uncharacterized membrane protein YuzA (DUF378 family)